ncbi:MAG TPA: flavin reductase family protein [Candidatus Limnocylindria bacterium]|nr:flavin reductase family protein [Candidatus Limnocylindria bacterium]
MIDAKELRRVMGHFATGVTIVTTRDDEGRPYGLTANAFTSLSLDPPLVLICIDRKAETFSHFYASRCFVVNLLTEAQEDLSNRFAKSGGFKFEGVAYETNAMGVPVLDGTLGHIECTLTETHEAGDHVIHIGRVEHFAVRGGRPLLFYQGRYRQLAGE